MKPLNLIPVLLTVALSVPAILSCHKDANPETGSGYWTMYTRGANGYTNTTYAIHYAMRTTGNGYTVLSGTDLTPGQNADSLQLWFRQLPVASGQYKIVRFPDSAGLHDNEMGVTITMPLHNLYTSTGIGSNITWLPPGNAMVSVIGDKIKVNIPEMTLIWTNSVTKGWDSTRLISGVLMEK